LRRSSYLPEFMPVKVPGLSFHLRVHPDLALALMKKHGTLLVFPI